MTPEQQQQFNQELQLVVAIAAQIRPCYDRADSAILGAMELIQAAEKLLKGHYEPKAQPAAAPETKPEPPVQESRAEPLVPKPSRETLNKSISAHSKIIVEKKLRTLDQLKGMVQAYGVKTKEELNDEQAEKLLKQLKEISG